MKLITFPPTYGEPTGSPFATKALCLLELSDAKYTIQYLSNPTKMPKQKLPVLDVSGELIPDSNEIKTYLETTLGFNFDEGLSKKDRAISNAFIRMVEEHTYFIVYTSRWKEDAHWKVTKEANFGAVPALLRGFITRFVRKGAIAQASAQGIGRHSKAERFSRFQQDIESIETLLGSKPYLFGETPTAADISIVPALSFIVGFPHKNDLSDLILSKENLMAYVKRGKEQMYPK